MALRHAAGTHRHGLARGYAWPRPSDHWRGVVMAMAVLVSLSVATAVWRSISQQHTVVTTGNGGGGSPARSAPGPPERYFDLHARHPHAFPSSRLALGFLPLDGSRQRAIDVFGRPATTEPDIDGTASSWTVAGAELTVSTWGDEPDQISGVEARVPTGSPARFAVFGGVVLGNARVGDVIDAWGDKYVLPTSRFDDVAVQYSVCIGPAPIVIKFDDDRPKQAGRVDRHALVTSMLVAYADEAPSTGGCGP